ncbi:FAD/NAD(P)-binding protein [Natrinema hispanicum]|uniref:Predicted flavoprotein CzcO associated with the cation diffusion facilitator CzcD n=1 Tax=Natrinema hispanicum TaxID=392421 RepID=A0A1I0JU19_9EURY|nr:FAD/NAD(P)-binding protein [Natrinema hispanicum]SDD62879.1 Predicted flavoprotein CzcO associated with the cation diffusion facilitator CzcD [Natrinema hispanicum]SEU13470.1 Predicted flavoprotein CzcO associated with the cation diffusion facilitator CzcD [Natrinema hispanicum]
MTTCNSTRKFGCIIVGGGIHGTYLAQRLLEDTPFNRSDVLIVDPHDRLLASFREKARACGMEELRSTFVHHVGTEPFGLESFAEANDRGNELVQTVDYPPRPSLDLFLDYSEYVIKRKDLESLHRRAAVDAIHELPSATGLRLETTAGPIDTEHCVLAIGHGNRYRWPNWAAGLDGVDHVWEGFDPNTSVDRTIVVGGGITAAQLACTLSETQSVVLLSRHPLEWEVSEADPPWINWSYLERNLHVHPPGSSDRLDVILDARHTATVPPYLYAEFENRIDDGVLTLTQGEVDLAAEEDESVRLSLDHGLQLLGDRVVLATGFEPVFNHPLIDRIVDELELSRGYREMPVLDDDTLAWQCDDERFVPLYVSGALALGSVGPYAPNIPGARRAGDRITAAITRRLRRSGAGGTSGSVHETNVSD